MPAVDIRPLPSAQPQSWSQGPAVAGVGDRRTPPSPGTTVGGSGDTEPVDADRHSDWAEPGVTPGSPRLRAKGRQDLLWYVTQTNTGLYRAIMDVFFGARAAYSSRMRPGDVLTALHTSGPALSQLDDPDFDAAELTVALDVLAAHGNLSADRDETRASSLAEYERKAMIYDLTPGGEAAHELVEALEEGLVRVGGLQTVVLGQILELLSAVNTELVSASPDGERAFVSLQTLTGAFKDLTGNASMFMAKVNTVLRSPALDSATLREFTSETVAYLGDFVKLLDRLTVDIAAHTQLYTEVDEARLERFLRLAYEASGQRDLLNSAAPDEWAARMRTHLAGVHAWFTAGPEATTGAVALTAKANEAVVGILKAVEALRASAAAPVSRSADLMALAAMFTECEDDGSAHSLYRAAFGLTCARHYVRSDADDGLVDPRTSWWDAPPLDVPDRVRSSPRAAYVRRPHRIEENVAARRALVAAAAAKAARRDECEAQLLSLDGCHIADCPPLGRDTADMLADLIGAALRGGHSGRTARAMSSDGRLALTITAGPNDTAAELVTSDGRLTLRNWKLSVTGAAAARKLS